ncbi:MAG: hypothetical protein SGILL_006203 [Bacillariaceae sp.]
MIAPFCLFTVRVFSLLLAFALLAQLRSIDSLSAASSSSSWTSLENRFASADDLPVSIDSVLDPSTPNFSSDRPTLFRERHGWCPYSERVWLTLELIVGMEYDTVRIDNTGGPRPSYYGGGGQTPQIRWPDDGKQQGESMDLVKELDARYNGGQLYAPSDVEDKIDAFRSIFPRARPSSRAAFLFQYNGEPLWKSTFEETLEGVDELLLSSSSRKGPFFCGNEISAADIAWAPFLERYRYQLPCLHDGLEPDDGNKYPNLAAWYNAMDQVPAYACRVKGDAGSWRKVLNMAGFGNAGFPPSIQDNIDERKNTVEFDLARQCINLDVWSEYASSRPYVAETPHEEAAAVLVRNRKALAKDTVKQITSSSSSYYRTSGPWSSLLPSNEADMDELLLKLANVLVDAGSSSGQQLDAPGGCCSQEVACLAAFLDERMCVPRDMGVMSAACIKSLSMGSQSTPATSEITGVTLKIALDQQGAVADLSEEKSERFTCAESLDMVHRLRRNSDAVLVGRSTVEIDDCTLTVRRVPPLIIGGQPQQPVRVVVDPALQLKLEEYKIVADGFPTVIVHSASAEECNGKGYVKKKHNKFPNVTLLGISTTSTDSDTPKLSAKAIHDSLAEACNIHHIMVEGGPSTALQFLAEKAVDRVILVKAPMTFMDPLPSNITEGTFQSSGLEKIGTYQLGVDTVECYSRSGLPWPRGASISDWP